MTDKNRTRVAALRALIDLQLIKDLIFFIVLYHNTTKLWQNIDRHGLIGYLKLIASTTAGKLIRAAKKVPGAGAKIQAELDATVASMERSIAPREPNEPRYLSLPTSGFTDAEVRSELARYSSKSTVDYRDGKVSGAVYHGGADHDALLSHAYATFSSANPLHPELFPGVRKMEAECVAMVLGMYNAPLGGAGAMTSGGTESILMACKAYRQLGEEKGVKFPEMVVPVTAHAAFDKAAHYFKIKLIHIPIDLKTGEVDIRKLEAAITKNTIMIAGSAPGFPHGIIDNIEALSAIAKRRNIGLHVDCCLGGFLVPFLESAGLPCPKFDFRLEGVTSISCDTHKYGFAPKGSSVVMYRTKALRHHQYFVAPDWTGGVYASPSIAGSRPGALIAGCWAAMMKMGRSGYIESTKKIVSCAREIEAGIRAQIPELEVIGHPLVSVVSFRSARPGAVNIYAVSDAMHKRSWNLNTLQNPSAVHIACTLLTVPLAVEFVEDLKASVKEVLANPNAGKEGQAAVYGLAATIPDRSIVADIAKGFVDCLYLA